MLKKFKVIEEGILSFSQMDKIIGGCSETHHCKHGCSSVKETPSCWVLNECSEWYCCPANIPGKSTCTGGTVYDSCSGCYGGLSSLNLARI